MQHAVDEAEYVLTVLQRMTNKASANLKLYDPNAQKRIEKAIARVEEVLRDAKSKPPRSETLQAA